MLEAMWYSAVIAKKVKYMCEQEKLRLTLVDLLIRLLAQVTCKYKVTIVIYFPIKYIKLFNTFGTT